MNQKQLEEEQIAFEKWAQKQTWIKDTQKYNDGTYGHWDTVKAWEVWLARAKIANQTPRLSEELKSIEQQLESALRLISSIKSDEKPSAAELLEAIRAYGLTAVITANGVRLMKIEGATAQGDVPNSTTVAAMKEARKMIASKKSYTYKFKI